MKFKKLLFGALMGGACVLSAQAEGWPKNYEGVMLQGFYWDSYSDTKWTNLEAKAPEYSKYFDLIWIPNSAQSSGSPTMGYMPIYWFTNHNSSFGTEKQLLSMIQTYKNLGTGIIADVVINHRVGTTNWYNFPTETWDGKTWKIGLEGICSNDEMAYAQGQPKPTGNTDTGDNFDGARDLDHTNANVQDNCKAYTRCLLEKYGYTGFRYDMVKGFNGQYIKMYNQSSKPAFSVGEYWDGYDAIAAWIEATGRESAAFDFPCKYAINEAFHSNDMSKLVWKANGTTDQPAGMIHFGYPQYAVTFVDNHDTYRDGSKFNGNIPAANAFILMSPGTPCVFLRHYLDYPEEIQALIDIRKSVGISNTSSVRVLRATSDCYMAEITGSKGKAAVKIGPAMVSPSGWNDSQIRTYGNNYCVWSTAEGGDDVDPEYGPASLYVIGNIPNHSWSTDYGVPFTKEGSVYTASNVTFEAAAVGEQSYFSFATKLGKDWDVVNSGDRYGATSNDAPVSPGATMLMQKFNGGGNAGSCNAWKVAPGTYDITVDFKNMTMVLSSGSTAVEGIEVEESAPVYYTLQGVRVSNPVKGTPYIVVRGSKATKEMAR